MRLGRYPVAVFTISKQELIDLGFWDRHRANISEFSRCQKSDDWIHTETFNFGSDFIEDYSDEIEVTFADEVK